MERTTYRGLPGSTPTVSRPFDSTSSSGQMRHCIGVTRLLERFSSKLWKKKRRQRRKEKWTEAEEEKGDGDGDSLAVSTLSLPVVV